MPKALTALACSARSNIGWLVAATTEEWRLLVLAVVMPWLALALAVALWSRHDFTDAAEKAHAATSTAAHVYEENARHTIEEIDAALLRTADLIDEVGLQSLDSDAALRRLKSLARGLPASGAIFVYDAKGNMVATSAEHPPPSFNAADRAYFQQLITGGEDIVIGPVLQGRTVHARFFPVARAVKGAAGRPIGVIQVGLDPAIIATALPIAPEDSVWINLYHLANGAPIARQPMGEGLPKELADPAIRDALAAPGAGDWFGWDRNADRVRLTVATRVAGYPLLVAASLDAASVYAGPRARLLWRILALLIVGGVQATMVARILAARRRALKSEERLRESNARYELVVGGAQAAIWDWDVPGRRVVFSPSWKKLRGLSDAEVSDSEEEWSKQIHPADIDRVMSAIQDHFSGRMVVFEQEYRVRHRDGHWLWVHDRGLARRDASGRVVRMAGSETDITARKAAEEALRESQTRLKSEAVALARLNEASSRLWAIRELRMGLDEVLSAAMGLLDADMGHVQLLDAERGVLKIAVHRGLTQEFLDFFREVSAREDTSSGRALRSRQRIVIEDVDADFAHHPIAHAAGYRAVQSTPLIGRDGIPIGMISTHFRSVHHPSEEELRRFDLYARQAADFIERHRMDEALRESESLYRAIGESIDYGIWICDPQGRNIYASESLLKLVGITQDQCKDFGWGNVLHPDDAEATIAAWKQCIQFGGPWYREHRYLGTDGQYHPILACGVPVRDARGQITQWAGINLDISRLKRAEEALRASEERLRMFQAEIFHASRLSEIGKMAAAIAHELNQPLAAVVSYIGGCRRILASGTEDEQSKRKVQETMEKASVQALRAGEIIRRLREFIGSGQRERRIEDAEILLREACTLAITSAKHNGISIRSDIRQSGHVLCDKIQFQQVIINLARNALEAMENSRRKELEFGLAKNGNNIEVSVSDTGPGIAPEIVDGLFKPFMTTRTGGMGIGLSVCREIVEAHDGKIWYEPSPNGGTVFRFTLPIVAEDMVA